MDPGLAILHHPMNDSAGILYCYIAQIPIRVPVLPRPALQWIAIAPSLLAKWLSHIFKNFSTMSSGGVDPSMKNKSSWAIPSLMNVFLSYFSSLSLITLVTLKVFLNI